MPNIGLVQAFKMDTRNKLTQVDAEVSLKVDGRELPNMGVLGEALELAIALIQQKITESYQVVPPRVGQTTEIAEPYASASKEPAA